MKQNKNRLDDLFHKAKNEAPKVSFDEIKANFVHSTTGIKTSGTVGKFAAFTNFKTVLIMIASIISAVTIISLSVSHNSETNNHSNNINTSSQIVNSLKNIDSVSSPIEAHNESIKKYIEKVERLKADFPEKENIELSLAKKMIDNTPLTPIKTNKQTLVVDTSYRFPTLTPEEIKENNKQKAKMIKQLLKFDKKQYAFIPAGAINIKDKEVAVQAFYMQTTEVSNLEYRTFLFDLLINDNKKDFLKAKPNQKMWVIEYEYAFNEPMKAYYFSHPAYNDYPVVAISREGAELYCKWLSKEVNNYNAKKGKQPITNLRIPTNYEWMYAASAGGKQKPYPWGGPYLRNSKGCFLANFYPMKDNYTADGAFHTAKVTSYNPNYYGLFCLSGNVAEMVYYNNENNTPGTKGGSWSSVGQELQIFDGKDRFKGVITPSVNIGFRPVITFLE